MALTIQAGSARQLGAHFDGAGTNFALFSENAAAVNLCIFSPDGHTEIARLRLPERTGPVWHGYVPGLQPGSVYGYRVEGPYAPNQGLRFNAHKLLLDPYTREFRGRFQDHPSIFGFDRGMPGQDLTFDSTDSAPYVAKSVVSDPARFQMDAVTLGRRWDGTLIYEAHVKGATILNRQVPKALQGTYEGLASDAMLDHLTDLGITSIELLPVHALKSEGFLAQRGLVNYWGYNTIGFFAPEPRYFGPAGVMGFRAMVDRFHTAGIEVILDVVYNHSGEGDHLGPTLSFRGLDNAAYYRLQAGQPRFYVNDTGCGNTLNLSHPFVLRMVMDSLRFWVQVMGVDGFRFDLATTLGREPHGFDLGGSFFDALRQDPVLTGVKLIAEPWDIGPGGYQLGNFPPEFAEWNDQYRDTVRRFWRKDEHSARDLGSALLGSAEVFDRGGRRSWASVNFAAAHDGFTLADTVQYMERHNEANREQNRDGHHTNYSDNFGVEGPSDQPELIAARRQRMRNILATVMVSQGTPMLLAGDEMGHSQGGNNNAYCQDNETTWLNWDCKDSDLIEFTKAVIRFRAAHPVLRQTRFLHGSVRRDGRPDVEWLSFDGAPLDWDDPALGCLCLLLRGCGESAEGNDLNDTVLLVFNRTAQMKTLSLPEPGLDNQFWVRELDSVTDAQSATTVETPSVEVAAHSFAAFSLRVGRSAA